MEKLIITAALTGAEVTKKHNPAVPYSVAEMVAEAKRSVAAGAAILHLHVRDDDGTPTQAKARYAEVLAAIREACPETILQVSTGGATYMTIEERIEVVDLSPEMASLDCGTVNFGGDEIFVNTENQIIKMAERFKEQGVFPELEVFDKGMVDMVLRLHKKGIIEAPLHFNFVLGVNGGMAATPRDLLFMTESIPPGATFTVSGIGRFQLTMNAQSILLGGHVRVGLEDNIYLSKGLLARSNADFVERIRDIALRLGREIATPDEARALLGMPGRKS